MLIMSKKIKLVGTLLGMFTLLGFAFVAWHSSETNLGLDKGSEVVSTADSGEELGVTVKEIEIQSGDSLSVILENAGVPPEDHFAILDAAQDVFDFSKIQAGKLMHVVLAQDAIAAIDYDLSAEKKIVIEKDSEGFEAKEVPIEYDITETVRTVTIDSSLFLDGSRNGLTDKTLIDLIEIFQWDIDFSTAIQPGDSFTVLYEERKTKDGQKASSGKILAAEITNQEKTYDAYYFELSDGDSGYYDSNGENTERQFLRSPISIGYISSGYTNRRVNPVTKQVAPHRSIDYAAPHGTPVVAIADGVVSTAGNRGGYGIMIEVEHGEYRSQFAHLSGVASGVRKGSQVTQGQVIGYVGSTGNSTGPHLQYALFKNGTPINPLTADLPAGKELNKSLMLDFETIRNKRIDQLRLKDN